ncbi:hypothetical protein ACP4OV_021657 [Aristida adscensionis]
MEGKRAAAAAALCCLLVVLLSGQPQPVAAMSNSMLCNCYNPNFCSCYCTCYDSCLSKKQSRRTCQNNCCKCCRRNELAIVPASAAGYGYICCCLLKLCCKTATGEAPQAGPAGVEDCGDCTKNL